MTIYTMPAATIPCQILDPQLATVDHRPTQPFERFGVSYIIGFVWNIKRFLGQIATIAYDHPRSANVDRYCIIKLTGIQYCVKRVLLDLGGPRWIRVPQRSRLPAFPGPQVYNSTTTHYVKWVAQNCSVDVL